MAEGGGLAWLFPWLFSLTGNDDSQFRAGEVGREGEDDDKGTVPMQPSYDFWARDLFGSRM